jgi:hypothetical protein
VCAACGDGQDVLCRWDAFADSGTGCWHCIVDHWSDK